MALIKVTVREVSFFDGRSTDRVYFIEDPGKDEMNEFAARRERA